jgi:hypothetical protein
LSVSPSPAPVSAVWRRPLGSALLATGGTALVVLLALAPWPYGGTRLWAVQWLSTFALVCAGVGLTGWLLREGRSPLPLWVLALALAALAGGAWHVFFGTPLEARPFTIGHLARLEARWPQSMMARQPSTVLLSATAAFSVLLLAAALGRDVRWRRAICAAIALAAVSATAVGLWQNAMGIGTILGEEVRRMPGNLFGLYFHHTLGGAQINLGLPLLIVLVLWLAMIPPVSGWRRGLGFVVGAAGIIVLVTGHFSHVGRLPQVVAAGMLVMLFPIAWTVLTQGVPARRIALLLCTGAVLILGVGALARHTERLTTIAERWGILFATGQAPGERFEEPPEDTWNSLMRDDLFVQARRDGHTINDRGVVYRAAPNLILAAGWFGHGPGSWTAVASHEFSHSYVRSFYLWVQTAHSDPLQTFVEWGWIGGAALLVLGLGALARLGRSVSLRSAGGNQAMSFDAALDTAVWLAIAGIGVQACFDFPLQVTSLLLPTAALVGLGWSAPLPARPLRPPPTRPASP